MRNIDDTIAEFSESWNRHDADALAAMWTDDGELNHPWGFRAVGRDAIKELLANEHAGSMAGSRLTVHRIAASGDERSNIAEIEGILEGVRAPNGRPYDLPHTISVMFTLTDSRWRIRTMTPRPNAVRPERQPEMV
jgi:uncharacterized protein (TIGR02246 family)